LIGKLFFEVALFECFLGLPPGFGVSLLFFSDGAQLLFLYKNPFDPEIAVATHLTSPVWTSEMTPGVSAWAVEDYFPNFRNKTIVWLILLECFALPILNLH